MARFTRWFRLLFGRGFKTACFSHHFERELTEDEVRRLESWMAGVNRAFDGVSEELGKMPHFAYKAEKKKTEASK